MARPSLTLPLLVLTAFAGLAVQRTPPDAAQEKLNTVYVTALEPTGTPVLDLAAADFTIKEDGKSREVVRVAMAQTPMQIQLLVDDNGSGIFRYALVQFVQQMRGRAEMALSTVVGQTQKLVDYTANVETLAKSIVTLSARPGTPDGGQLLEAIF